MAYAEDDSGEGESSCDDEDVGSASHEPSLSGAETQKAGDSACTEEPADTTSTEAEPFRQSDFHPVAQVSYLDLARSTVNV